MNARQLLKNPIVLSAMKSAKQQGRRYGTISTLVICLSVLNDNYGFTTEQLDEFYKKVDDMADSLIENYVTLEDMVKALDEYYGLKLPAEDIALILGKDIEDVE
ncbi:hypothetical protein [uncultured Duncaniella sp.]|uniref:hypothetical protein n=1 Tax=uncultured Duncaniella sp. TaxID=2768039 RepID=UPI00262628FF|nr:hypothetical protein [uncultured Duncaniella sp.]